MAGKHVRGKKDRPAGNSAPGGGAGSRSAAPRPPRVPGAAAAAPVAASVPGAAAAPEVTSATAPAAPLVDEYGLPLDDSTIREELVKRVSAMSAHKVALGPVIGVIVVVLLLGACLIARAGSDRQANAAFSAGIKYFDLGDYPRAAQALKEAVAYDPANAKAEQMLGWSLDATNDLKGAAQHYEAYLKLSPRNAEVWYNLGAVYRQRKDYKKAVRCFKKALAIDSGYFSAAGELGDMYVATGEYQKGIEQYRRLIGLSHSNVKIADLHVTIGRVYAKAGNRASAIREWKLALRIDPTSTKARSSLASP